MKPIISKSIRVRCRNDFDVGKNSIIDDYCYFSTRVKIGEGCHIASGCSIAGGRRFLFELGDFSSVSSGVKIWCVSNDYTNDVVTVAFQGSDVPNVHALEGNVCMGRYTGVGANSVIMPDNIIPEGTVIGALSYVPPRFVFKPWSVYAGIPIRRLGKRNKKNVISQVVYLERFIKKATGNNDAE